MSDGRAASATTAMAPRATASRANAVPSAFSPRSATNTDPAATSRESLVTDTTGAAAALASGAALEAASNGARPATAASRSPSVIARLLTAPAESAGGQA